ncbi:glycosyltransferase family 4 protein [Candidatus Aminicenantes bacterium AC-708-M15]|jgi:glycosyltransferase involved in cell wall biosynthesis|nr:glycosyltransferase family 4 protein [SCandidatus Aminicenantes bacterium Aminicenantia_JdfR_composite]MCP2596369.1 glycosyltransferase family 4 protein [Candidatus Aminicenantes bacterium AC-335-G13]MCP2604102.1 glycosyltransferase family 4 protein [Candidatus Aminicenantes bacterium AC-708-M15]MCP2605391.1 glycosyltransferase family 4 protein [Candidatus Aminicenantes bacterium AC-335-O07]MCP2605998.1 glycosyltransferase family 4 protein [Candidatus Aminicenantes bacterium AC-708-I09]MCP2
MKIAALLPHFEVFGGVRRYLEIGNELIKRGHEYVIFNVRDKKVEWFDFRGSIKSMDQIEKDYFDFAICSEYSILNHFEKIKAKRKIFYFILEGHKREKEVIKKDYIFLGNSIGICKKIERKYGKKCFHAPGGINPEIFYPIKREKDEKFRILCYGRIYKRRKGINKIIKAVEKLYKKYKFLELILFDTPVGKEKIDIRKLIKPKVPTKFFINLPQDKMAWLYSQGDVFVSAEKRAGWSNTTAEAMACKIPVICTKSGTQDFAINNQTALIISFNHPLFIAKKIENLIKNEELRCKLAENGYRKIHEFTWSKLVDKLESIFNDLL